MRSGFDGGRKKRFRQKNQGIERNTVHAGQGEAAERSKYGRGFGGGMCEFGGRLGKRL